MLCKMSVTTDMGDITGVATRMAEAGRMFSRASLRALEFLANISGVRRTVQKTMPFGKGVLQMQNTEMVLAALRNPKLMTIFKDPAAMLKGEKYVEVARDITERSITSASDLVLAASLVFAHAVFDATLFDYCRVTAWLAQRLGGNC
jgi:hypothetical protein